MLSIDAKIQKNKHIKKFPKRDYSSQCEITCTDPLFQSQPFCLAIWLELRYEWQTWRGRDARFVRPFRVNAK